jgi:hypothetical protein
MVAVAAAADARESGFTVCFVGADGGERRGPLDVLWNVSFERAHPVRAFHSVRGQRSYWGGWWSATTGAEVGFESWLERDHVMLLDFDPRVVGLACQPFWLSWRAGGRTRRHAPDLFARLDDGTGMLVDVRPDDRIGPADADVFAVTEQAARSVGWRYRRVGAVDPVLAANVRWLAGYRHRRCLCAEYADRLPEVFARPRPLAEGAAAVGDRLAALPTLFHLLWSGVLRADLSRALAPTSVVSCPAGAR